MLTAKLVLTMDYVDVTIEVLAYRELSADGRRTGDIVVKDIIVDEIHACTTDGCITLMRCGLNDERMNKIAHWLKTKQMKEVYRAVDSAVERGKFQLCC